MAKIYNNSEPPCYEVFKDKDGMWRWHYVASNGRIIADSGEGYHNRADCDRGIEIMKASHKSKVWSPKD